MSIPYHVLRDELRRYLAECYADVARAQLKLNEALRQYRQAEQDEREDAMDRAQEIIDRRRR